MANLRKEIVELYQTVFDKMESAFGNMENLFSDRQSYIEKYMELLELQDEAKPASAYTDLMKVADNFSLMNLLLKLL